MYKKKQSIKSFKYGGFISTLLISMCMFSSQSAQSEELHNLVFSVTQDSKAVMQDVSYPKLFGQDEKHHSDISAFRKWSGMFERFENQMLEDHDMEGLTELNQVLQKLTDKTLREKLVGVNDYINDFSFIPDHKNWQRGDYWATPIEFLKYGGDCEDYAIAKYISLRALGVSDHQMRIAVVQDTVLDMPHALLVVYDGADTLVLDNQSDQVLSSDDIDRYTPIYSISQTAWWKH